MTDKLITLALRSYIVFAFLFIFAPIVVLIVFSFNDDRFPSLPFKGFSTTWYNAVFNDPDIVASFKSSIWVAACVAAIATLLGAAAAYAVNRYEFPGKNLYLAVAVLPPTIPLIVLGLSLLVFLNQISLSGSRLSIVLGQVVLCASFSMAIVRLRLVEMDQSLEQAAWNLGSSEWRAIKEVILPQIAPALVASFLLTAAISFDEFMVAWFVSGLDVTLPVKIFALLEGQVSPRINAIGSIVFGITITLVVLAQLVLTRWNPGRQQEGLEDEVSQAATGLERAVVQGG